MSDPADLGVRGAVTALAAGELSALELVLSNLERITSERGRALNAFIHVAGDCACEQARESDRRRAEGKPRSGLDGVPIAIKDNIDVAGLPTTNGLATQWIPTADAPVARRFRDAGMVILGKLNMHEGALGATTDNRHHGRCAHPAFPGFTPGGSSGGSATAVAGGLCAVALGTDTMGSVRLPAAYCGVVGFKPSQTYWPATGVMPLAFGLDTIGPLARSVDDIAVLLGERLENLALQGLRFARLENVRHVDAEPECEAAFEAALALLIANGIGVQTERVRGYEPGPARRAGFIVSEADAAAAHKELLAESLDAFSPEFLAMLRYGEKVSSQRYRAERGTIERAGSAFLELFDRVDVVLSLTAPQRSFSFAEPAPVNQADFTAIANFAGCPAISLPLPVPPNERPIGLQLIAAPQRDTMLLPAAAQLELMLKS
jgi:aspartyl-tRNA(Asn)/glutamyl-tRNA(Gln) amidotransferase subunit A